MSYYRKDGTPYPEGELGLKMFAEDFEYGNNRIGETYVNDYYVSTVWLGIDHDPLGDVPLIFETMAFHNGNEVYMQRYSTLIQAQVGHRFVVSLMRKRVNARKRCIKKHLLQLGRRLRFFNIKKYNKS